jgi:hypothetical protein
MIKKISSILVVVACLLSASPLRAVQVKSETLVLAADALNAEATKIQAIIQKAPRTLGFSHPLSFRLDLILKTAQLLRNLQTYYETGENYLDHNIQKYIEFAGITDEKKDAIVEAVETESCISLFLKEIVAKLGELSSDSDSETFKNAIAIMQAMMEDLDAAAVGDETSHISLCLADIQPQSAPAQPATLLGPQDIVTDAPPGIANSTTVAEPSAPLAAAPQGWGSWALNVIWSSTPAAPTPTPIPTPAAAVVQLMIAHQY